jgi:hypothetical protein
MTIAPYEHAPPLSECITPYDEAHFVTYIRLLDANAEGADWREAVHYIFEIDPAADPERARQLHDNHLKRAKWMTETGYLLLLQKAREEAEDHQTRQ